MQIYYALMLGIIVTVFFSVTNVSAADEKAELEKSPRHGEWVKVTAANDRVINAFVVYPEVKEPATSIIVIHEIFGLTDWIRLVADRLAADGFVAICPDLLSGMGPDGGGTESFGSGDDVRRAIRELPASQVASDLDAVQKYVRELPQRTIKSLSPGSVGAAAKRSATQSIPIQSLRVSYSTVVPQHRKTSPKYQHRYTASMVKATTVLTPLLMPLKPQPMPQTSPTHLSSMKGLDTLSCGVGWEKTQTTHRKLRLKPHGSGGYPFCEDYSLSLFHSKSPSIRVETVMLEKVLQNRI